MWDINHWWDRIVCAVLGHIEGAPEIDLSGGQVQQVVHCERCSCVVEDE